MKKLLAAFALLTVAAGAVYAGDPSVGLKVDHPKITVNKTVEGKSTDGKIVEKKKSTAAYKGKISCTPPKGATFNVTLEAYYITRELEKGAKDEVEKQVEIGKYEFGGENASTQTIEFSSPEIEETETKTIQSYGRNRKIDKVKEGKRYMGVLLRVLSPENKVIKVISEPSNPAWIKAGKKESVEF